MYLAAKSQDAVDLPTRTKQKKAESDSYAILLYKLRRLGIFRNVTDNDYGVDFEVELTSREFVTGAYFKAQVKAANTVRRRGPGKVPVVGGIKQSTLNYWCRLSHRSHVIAYAVDLNTEKVYLSRPVFWAATQLIDGSGALKSLDFIPAVKEPKGKQSPSMQDMAVVVWSYTFAHFPQVPEQLQAITTALRHLPKFLRQRNDVHLRDVTSEITKPETFQALLDVSRILLFEDAPTLTAAGFDFRNIFKFDWWVLRSDISAEDVNCEQGRNAYDLLLPLLVDRLTGFRDAIITGAFYWRHADRSILQLAHETPLPSADMATLDAWGEDYDRLRAQHAPKESFTALLFRIEATAHSAKAARTAKLQARRSNKSTTATTAGSLVPPSNPTGGSTV